MKLRRLISVTLAICLTLCSITIFGITAYAETAYSIYSASPVEAVAGETVSVPVYISDNEGLMGYDMSFSYDESVLTPESVTRGDVMTDGFFEDDIEGKTSTNNSFRVFWSHAYQSSDNGILFYLNFKVGSKATGSTIIKTGYDSSATFDGSFNDVALNCQEIKIQINNNEYDDNPTFTMSAGNINAGESLELVISVENVGKMESVTLSVAYDNSEWHYEGASYNGIEASSSVNENSVEIKINKFNLESGNIITMKFSCHPYAIAGSHFFSAEYSNLAGVERVLIKDAEVTVNSTDTSDSAIIYSNSVIKGNYEDGQLTVPLYIKHNTGLMGYRLDFEYDSNCLEIAKAESGGRFSGSLVSSIGNVLGSFSCIWYNTEQVSDNGELLLLTFNVLTDEQKEGAIKISYSQNDTFDESYNSVKLQIEDINYCLNQAQYKMGDVNLDGVVSIRDATELQMYVVEIKSFSETQKVLADANHDGSINIADATEIQRYIVELIPSLE